MDKKFWGPSTWCSIHTATLKYRPENSESFINFITSLPYLLPCEYCREHLQQNLQDVPFNSHLGNSQEIFVWGYILHDTVNRQLNKHLPIGSKKVSPPLGDVYKYYLDNYNNNSLWGPCFWRMIHSFAASYRPSPEIKAAFIQFIYALPGIIPCETCKAQFMDTLNRIPLTDSQFTSAGSLFLWTFLVHDDINKKLGKNSPSYEEVKNIYFDDSVCKSCSVA